MPKKNKGQYTENKFSKYCKDHGYYKIKLQIDKSRMNINGQVLSRAMPSDFIVITKNQVKFIEIKEILKNNSFPNNRFRQQFKLTKLSEHYDTGIMEGYLLLNFVKYNIICYFEIGIYNKLLKLVGKKSLNIGDIPSIYTYNGWKELIL